MDRFFPGQKINKLPSELLNAISESKQKVAGIRLAGGPGASGGADQSLEILVVNETGVDLTADFPVVRLTDPAFTTPDDFKRQRIVWKGETPDEDTIGDFAVLQSPVVDGEPVVGVFHGFTVCQVDFTDADHEYAQAKDGDNAKLVSDAASGVPVKYKEPGTGVKWAIVKLGSPPDAGGGGIYRVVTQITASTYDPDDLDPNGNPRFIAGSGLSIRYEENAGKWQQKGTVSPIPGSNDDTVTIYNMVPSAINKGVFIQTKTIDGLEFADVENC